MMCLRSTIETALWRSDLYNVGIWLKFVKWNEEAGSGFGAEGVQNRWHWLQNHSSSLVLPVHEERQKRSPFSPWLWLGH